MRKPNASQIFIDGDSAIIVIGKHRIVFDKEMLPIIRKFTWHVQLGKKTFYAVTHVKIGNKYTKIGMHRLLCGLPFFEVDHKNRNGLDNRCENLRVCLRSENARNRVWRNSLGFRGIYKKKNKYGARIHVPNGGPRIERHGFSTPEEAAMAYDELSRELHGEFGVRNFGD